MSKTVNLCQGNLKFTCNTFFCGTQSEHLSGKFQNQQNVSDLVQKSRKCLRKFGVMEKCVLLTSFLECDSVSTN